MPRENKRQRHQPAEAISTPAPSKPMTPMRIATTAIDTFVESLREEVKPTLGRKARAYLTEVATCVDKCSTIHRMKADDTFIPRSARINFTLKTNKETADSDEFKELAEANDTLVTETKQKLRANIIKSLEIEFGKRVDKIIGLITEAVNLAVLIAMAENDSTDDIETAATRAVFTNLIPAINETTMITEAMLSENLDVTHPAPAPAAQVTQGEQGQQPQPQPQPPAIPAPVSERARELASALFIIPLRKWMEAKKDQELRNKLRSIVNPETKKATKAAAMELDEEPTLSEAKVNDLIKEAVAKETKALRNELAKLKKNPRSNSPHPKAARGHRQGASEKEKQSQKNKNKNASKKQVRFANGQADADANGSNKNNGILKPSSYRRSSKKSNANRNKNKRGKKSNANRS